MPQAQADARDEIRNPDCTLCELHTGAQYVCLMGSGPMPARVMIIGEAPGEREDERHRAFVGASGKLLDELLLKAGLNRKQCYVTNAAKCRPPANRTPSRGELKTCATTYLAQEIDAVRPTHILTLGNPALQVATGNSGIRKHRGLPKRLHHSVQGEWSGKLVVFPTYHPAAVLRNPRLRGEVEADIERFGRMVRGEAPRTKTDVRIIRTKAHLRWLIRQLMHVDVISYDIETYTAGKTGLGEKRSNLQEWHGKDSMITSLAFSWKPGQAAAVPLHNVHTPWRNPDRVLQILRRTLERSDAKYIGHNGKFDARWLRAKGINARLTFDTMLAAHMLDENRPKGLKPLSQLLLGADAYDVGEELDDSYRMPLKRLCVYNGKDTDYTLRLYHVFRQQLAAEPRIARVFSKLMMPASEALADIDRYGVWVDPSRWAERHGKTRQNVDKLDRYINRHVPKARRPINLNSPQQVGELLFEDLGLDILERTKKGAASTKESVLQQLAKRHKVPAAMLKYRKWAKYLSTYLLPFKYDHIDADHRIHSSYKLFGTVTGRLSGEGGIQQVPRDPFIRSILGAPAGWVWVTADYSQIELRIAAMLSHERRMLRMFAAGEDIHLNTAAEMTGKRKSDVAKEERKRAKAVNFGFLYSMGWQKFVTYALDNYDVVVSDAEAQRYRERYFESYPALLPWHDRQRRLARRYGRVHSPIGRVRHLPDIESRDKEVRSESERQAINSPVQSFASDLMLLSLIQLHAELDVKRAFIVGTVHDSILFQVRERAVDRVLPRIREVMEDTYVVRHKFGVDLTVPVKVDMEVGSHWGEGEAYG